MSKLLIIDDDPQICQFLSELLETMGYDVAVVNTLENGKKLAYENHFDLILLDLEFPEGNGLQILPVLLQSPSLPEVIIITGTGDIKGAEIAFKYGAWDYVQKPFIKEEVSLPIKRALQYRREKESTKTPVTLNRRDIIGESSEMMSCLDEVAKASVTDASVLITGETGTGKELFAKAIHQNSKRSSGNFIIVDCGSIPDTLAESILFGYEKGAFTGADKKKQGIIVQAEGGTLFLDEIGDLPIHIQKTFLRTLQERTIRPLAGKHEVRIDFRLVAATNRDLDQMVKENNFREDLLFRIRAIEIKLPPLRERGRDIIEIATKKVHEISQQYGIGAKGLSTEFIKILCSQNWPGNVRELINALEYALASAAEDPVLVPKHLSPKYRTAFLKNDSTKDKKALPDGKITMDSQGTFPQYTEYRSTSEKVYLQALLKRVDGNRKEASRVSGISLSRLYDLVKKHDLTHNPSS